MRVNGQSFRTIWQADAGGDVAVIDQTLLPFAFEVRTLRCVEDAATSVKLSDLSLNFNRIALQKKLLEEG